LKNTDSIEAVEVARYYVMSELGKKSEIWNKSEQWVEQFNSELKASPISEITEKAKKLSEERDNELFLKISSRTFTWREKQFHSSELHLPQINPQVNQYLLKVDWNLDSFSELVRGVNDLSEFHDDGRKIWHDKLIALDEVGTVRIIDGSHRAVIMRNRGRNQFQAYIGSYW
jgi:hypothetical protein